MRHLSPAELVDYAEGSLDRTRLPHLETCERCRADANALQATLRETTHAAVAIPEPSPLFWDHFSARLRERLAAEGSPASTWSVFGIRTFVPLGAFAVLLAVLITPLGTRPPSPAQAARHADARQPASVEIDQPFDPSLDATIGEAWDVLTAAAADVEWDSVHDTGMAPTAGAVDRAVQQLTDSELHELGRLLQSELKRSSN